MVAGGVMAARLEERLRSARHRSFVGRRAELATFTALLREPEPTCAVLFVWGPGGVGKSTLLRRFCDLAVAEDVPCRLLDARQLAARPDALADELAPASDDTGRRAVLLLDTYETLAGLDAYVRDDLLPRQPADTLVVLASQQPPSAAWRTDPSWSSLVRTVPLRNLAADESRELLSAHGVPDHLQDGAVEFTRGHPLALALVGEVLRHGEPFTPEGSPDVLAVLVDRFLRTVPTVAHVEALEAAAVVRVLTEPLLQALLPAADARALFAWLRGLPIVDSGPSGLVLHDLARDVVDADLRWRNPSRHQDLHERARRSYLGELPAADAPGRSSALLDLMYLHDDLRPFLRPPDRETPTAGLRVGTLRDVDDVPAITAMVARHEGEPSADLARHWCERRPDAWLVVRDSGGVPVGTVCLLDVQDATADDMTTDPAVAAVRRQLTRMPALRPGERVTHMRFWLARDTYQDVSPVQSLIGSELTRHILTTPDLAVTLVPFADPAPWAELCAYVDHHRMPDADFTVDGVPYTVFGHDWRTVPPAAWVALLSARETSGASGAPAARPPETVLVLSEPEFGQAVRAALKDLTRPDRLRHNPLLRARLVTSRVPADARDAERVAALQDAVREAAARLAGSPGDARGHRALHRAYLAPASTLERAAEALGLPSSTFRRHLAEGVSRLTALLWQAELGTW